MRMSTKVWAQLESVGKPTMTKTMRGVSVHDFALGFARWITTIHMGSHLRVIVARSDEDLARLLSRGTGVLAPDTTESMMSILESMIAQDSLDLDNDPQLTLIEDEDD